MTLWVLAVAIVDNPLVLVWEVAREINLIFPEIIMKSSLCLSIRNVDGGFL
jgi:hypothetical protein